jgi:hypothetical protein
MGIVYVEEGQPFVYEAIQPVRLTRLEDWERRGEGGHFVVKRLRDADRLLTADSLSKMKAEGRRFQGRNYDLYFEWSDDRMYCSEWSGKSTTEGWVSRSAGLRCLETLIFPIPQ